VGGKAVATGVADAEGLAEIAGGGVDDGDEVPHVGTHAMEEMGAAGAWT